MRIMSVNNYSFNKKQSTKSENQTFCANITEMDDFSKRAIARLGEPFFKDFEEKFSLIKKMGFKDKEVNLGFSADENLSYIRIKASRADNDEFSGHSCLEIDEAKKAGNSFNFFLDKINEAITDISKSTGALVERLDSIVGNLNK